jgi:hypothetical protein
MKRVELTDRQHRILKHFLARSLGQYEMAERIAPKTMWTDQVYAKELANSLFFMSLAKSLETKKEWM